MALAQKITPEQEQLQRSLQQVWAKKDLSQDIKVQQSLSLINSFIVKNPAQVTPELAKAFSEELNKIKAAVNKVWKEYDNFLVRNYNPYYWKTEDVVKVDEARAELKERISRMSTALERASSRLHRFATFDPDAPSTFKFPGVRIATKEDDLQAAIEGISVYLQECNKLQKPIEEMAAVLEKVDISRENTKTFGKILTGTAIIITGMWLGAVLGLGTAGTAAVGGTAGGVAEVTENVLGEGRLPTAGEFTKGVAFGALLGGLSHLRIGGHALAHTTEATAAAGTARAVFVLAEAEGIGMATVRTITTVAREAQPIIRVGAQTTKAGKTAAKELFSDKSEEYEVASR